MERFDGWQRRGKYTKRDGIWKIQVQFVFEREATSTGETAEKQEYKVDDSTLSEPVSPCPSMYSPVHVHLGGSMLRTRSKANNFIGGLHNSAPIPGVIVFPLRLSYRDESLMHSCLGIMECCGSATTWCCCRREVGERNEWGCRVCTYRWQVEHIKRWVRVGQLGEHEGSRIFCVHIFDSRVYLYLHLSLMLCSIYRRWIFKDDNFFFFFTAAWLWDALKVAGWLSCTTLLTATRRAPLPPAVPRWPHRLPTSCNQHKTGETHAQREERVCSGLEHSGEGRTMGFVAWHSR